MMNTTNASARRMAGQLSVLLVAGALSCQSPRSTPEQPAAATDSAAASLGTIERLDPALDNIVSPNAVIEVLSSEHEWTEGPLWLPQQNALLFSDIPRNTVYQWTSAGGLEEYLKPAGYTGAEADDRREPGSNGLLLSPDNKLVLCQHGDRRMAMMDAPLDAPIARYTTLAGAYDGKRLNSPNDATYHSNGDLYFTDPPYGLAKQMDDPGKEIPFQGVYRVSPDGTVTLLVDSLTRPNGIAFAPDEKTLFIANSDPAKAMWYAYDVRVDGTLANGRVFHDATSETAHRKGLPDGMKTDRQGNLFATGPGGVYIFSATGKLVGRILLDNAASNTALADEDKVLFVTNDMYVLRVKLRP